VPMSRPSPWME